LHSLLRIQGQILASHGVRPEAGLRTDAIAGDESPLDWRGPNLSRRYRQLPVDSVPDDLDRLILDHARAAVAAPAPHRTWIHWGWPLGLVGSALLAATLVLEGTREPRPLAIARAPVSEAQISEVQIFENVEAPQTSLTESPAGTASREPDALAPSFQPRPAALTIAPRDTQAPARTSIPARASVSTTRVPQAPVAAEVALEPDLAASAPSERPLDTPPTSAARAEPLEHLASTGATAAPAQTEAESPSPFEGLDALRLSTANSTTQPAAEDRLEDIRYMRQTGRKRGADKAWRKFLEDFPSYPVAADDIARPRE
jgi:hypothetical protein